MHSALLNAPAAELLETLRSWSRINESSPDFSRLVAELDSAWKALTGYAAPLDRASIVAALRVEGLDGKLRALFQSAESAREYVLAAQICAS